MIRTATRADRPRISEIRFAVRENRASNPALVESLTGWLFAHSTFWVWEEDGAIQGFSAADPRDGSICALFVHPSYERRGIGRALLSLACDVLKESGHATAVLTTEAGTRAERFYRTDGWTEVGHKEDGQIIFQKSLGNMTLTDVAGGRRFTLVPYRGAVCNVLDTLRLVVRSLFPSHKEQDGSRSAGPLA